MPLSEHEQRLLDQLEKQLGADDPTFAQSMNNGSRTVQHSSLSPRNLVIGALVTLVGLGIVIAGVTTKLIIVGVFGFLIAAAGIYYATMQSQKVSTKTQNPSGSQAKSSAFMKNLEDKWDERQNGRH